jgi:hypothetical protein
MPKPTDDGTSVHEECYIALLRKNRMKKPDLLITLTPAGDPLLKGSCSACKNVTFAFVGNTAENHRLMQLAFDNHFREDTCGMTPADLSTSKFPEHKSFTLLSKSLF